MLKLNQKKVSGTLKLDQAQFRELEAFAKLVLILMRY
jgi:F0F1-type ATP synthase alpha subunit